MSQESIVPINFYDKNSFPQFLVVKSVISQEVCKMEDDMDDFFNTLGQLDDAHKANWIKEIKTPLVESDENRKSLKLRYNVRNYAPEEVTVKHRGNILTVEAKHEEVDTKSHVFKEYKRSVILPEGTDGDKLYAETTKNGILTVSVPIQDAQLDIKEEITPVEGDSVKEEKSSTIELLKPRKSSSGSKKSKKGSEKLDKSSKKGKLKKKGSGIRKESDKIQEGSSIGKLSSKRSSITKIGSKGSESSKLTVGQSGVSVGGF